MCPSLHVPPVHTMEKSLTPPSLLHSHQYLYTSLRSPKPSLTQMCSFFSFTSSSLSHLISLNPNIPPNIKLSQQLFPLPVTMEAFFPLMLWPDTRLLLEDTGSRRASPRHKRLPSNTSVSSSSLVPNPSFLLQEQRGQPSLGTTSHKDSEPGEAIWMARAWLYPCPWWE